jgi:hypothetical protein
VIAARRPPRHEDRPRPVPRSAGLLLSGGASPAARQPPGRECHHDGDESRVYAHAPSSGYQVPQGQPPMGSPGLSRRGPLLWPTGILGKVACHRSAGHSGPTTPRASSGADHAPLMSTISDAIPKPVCAGPGRELPGSRRRGREHSPSSGPVYGRTRAGNPNRLRLAVRKAMICATTLIASLTGQARRFLPACWPAPASTIAPGKESPALAAHSVGREQQHGGYSGGRQRGGVAPDRRQITGACDVGPPGRCEIWRDLME